MQADNMLKEYRNWAVIGATADEEKYGYKIYKKLKEKGYYAFAVSPKYDEIDGDKTYKDLDEIPTQVEVAVFVVNPKIGLSYVEKCAELGIKNIWLQPGTVSDDLLSLAEEKGLNVVQACVLVAASYL